MLILLLFIFANMGVSLVLEKSRHKYTAAKILHAVLFLALFIILIVSQNRFVFAMVDADPGKDGVSLFYEIVTYTGAYNYSPLMVAEISVPFVLILLSAAFAYKAVKYAVSRASRYVPRPKLKPFVLKRRYGLEGKIRKIYIINCVMIC